MSSKPKAGDHYSYHTSGDWVRTGDGRLYNTRTGQYATGSGGGMLYEDKKGNYENR